VLNWSRVPCFLIEFLFISVFACPFCPSYMCLFHEVTVIFLHAQLGTTCWTLRSRLSTKRSQKITPLCKFTPFLCRNFVTQCWRNSVLNQVMLPCFIYFCLSCDFSASMVTFMSIGSLHLSLLAKLITDNHQNRDSVT
jgi:hypothetical protein